MFAGSVWLYLRTTHARDRIGGWALWTFIALQVLFYFGGARTAPPSVPALAWTSLVGWLMPVWAGWADRHREPVPAGAGLSPP